MDEYQEYGRDHCRAEGAIYFAATVELRLSQRFYNLLCLSDSLSPTSCLARSRRIFRRILPDGFFGISSTTTTPPSNRLCLLTRSASQLEISFGEGVWSFCKVMYARGSSSPDLMTMLVVPYKADGEAESL